MKLALKLYRSLSTTTNKQINLNIKVDELIDKYEAQLIKEADMFQLPLSRENSILAYTSRFAKSVINLENINPQKKKYHYKAIKASMLRNNRLTPVSCIELCESLVHFPFDGDETKILQMLRNYADQSRLVFSFNQIDRFNMSYKYLMVDKLIGPIKFVNFQIPKDNHDERHVVNKIKYLFTLNKINTFNVRDWELKKELQFQFKVGQKMRRIKVKGYKHNLKADQQQLIAKDISKLVEKDQKVMLVKNNVDQQYEIAPEKIAKELLIDNKNWRHLHQIPDQTSNSNKSFEGLITMIKQKIRYQNEHFKVIEVTPMNYLNGILNLQSEAALKQLFGYIKFNVFHVEVQKLLHLLSFQKRKHLKQMFPLSFSKMLELEEQKQYNFITPQYLAAKSIVDLIVRTDTKTFTLYLNEESVYDYLYFFINYSRQRSKMQLPDPTENRNIKIIKNKLALSSILYDFNLKMPVLEQNLSLLRKTMFPLTFEYRYPKTQ